MPQAATDRLAVSQKLIVGVDMAKTEFAAGSVWQTQYHYQGKQPNSEQGCRTFIAALETLQQACGAAAIHLIIEPTGGYEAQLVSQAYQRQWRVTLVNPLTVRHWQQGRGKRGKADRLDTQMLTLFGADQNPPRNARLTKRPRNSTVCCAAKTIYKSSCTVKRTAWTKRCASPRRPKPCARASNAPWTR